MDVMLPLTVKITLDKRSKDAPFVAYTPELDVVSCGPTEEKARKNLQEAINIFFEELEKKGKVDEFLMELGFIHKKKQWIPPRVSFEPFFFSIAR